MDHGSVSPAGQPQTEDASSPATYLSKMAIEAFNALALLIRYLTDICKRTMLTGD